MSVDVEAGGALATAGLAAKAIDGHAQAHGDGTGASCANCGATLAGAYCHVCGQTAHVHRSLLHMLEEGLHGVLHFDSKSWRTLPLLIGKPGLLTRRYIDGQRVRYVSPLALFLFMIFLMFFVVSSVSDAPTDIGMASSPEQARAARADLAAEVKEAEAQVAEQKAAVAAATSDEEREEATRELEAAQAEARVAGGVLAVFDKAVAESATTGTVTMTLTPEELKAITGWDVEQKASNVIGSAPEVLRKIKENPDLYLYKLKNTAYKFAFVLVPISLPFLWLMFFWRRNVTMYDHMVFSLYSLSFMSLLIVVMALLTTTEFTSRLVGYLLLIPPVHMFFHLRGTYGLSKRSALWRTFALLAAAGTVFILFMTLIAVISYV